MRRSISLVMLYILLVACGIFTPAGPSTLVSDRGVSVTLNVFAAASLSDAFKEIGGQFEAANSDVKLSFNFAGSDQLGQQIGQGAPVDVFASANTKQMDAVVQAGEVDSGSDRVFVRNRLVLVYPRDNPANIQTLHDLSKSGIKIVLANKNVPVGAYTLDFLAKASKLPAYTATYSETVLKNVVSYEQNVKAVLSKVSLGEADAGIVYITDAVSVKDSSIGMLEIPDELNVIGSYPIAVVKLSQHPDQAQQFVAYVLSAQGQAVLKKYGFMTP